MTQEIFNKANDLNHDINILKNIKSEQDKSHWVKFTTPQGEEDSLWVREIRDDFKNFISSELEKAQKLLQEL